MDCKSLTLLICVSCLLCVSKQDGGECQEDADCEIEFAACINTTCICPVDFVPNNVYTKCLKVVHSYGENCIDSVQCSTSLKSGGTCLNGTCTCQVGYHYLRGKCWKSLGLGDKCKHSDNCWVSNDFESSVCNKDHVCTCATGYYQREHTSCRRESHKPGEPCGISLDCKFDNAVCTMNRTCEINTNVTLSSFIAPANEKIIPPQTLSLAVGDNCTSSTDCPEHASCTPNGICLCNMGFYTLDQTCHPVSRYIGWSCLRDEQCSLFGPNSICLNKKCACNNESRFVEDQMFCWITKKTGEACTDDKDCGSGNVTCPGGKCACMPGNHPSSGKNSCRTDSVNFGEPCVESLDCVFPNAICNMTSKNCICKEGYIRDGTKCKPGNGGECLKETDCTVARSICVDSTCKCEEGYISNLSFDSCMPLTKKYGGQCESTVQCSELNADCVENKCKCRPGMHYAESWKCYVNVNVGESCTHEGQCPPEHSHCLKGFCVCDRKYHVIYDGNRTFCSGAPALFYSTKVQLSLISCLLYIFIRL
ncbi:protein draper-like isoform X2 [Cimex lectularius]|uniref:EGF-like domain-containing protein n=1 Tax=Cimex lectularius TaxID=79782 RepID=A0A8I6ST34_CIMLE|nr:protein draper-like isoform X2 [Cimex lectularius]